MTRPRIPKNFQMLVDGKAFTAQLVSVTLPAPAVMNSPCGPAFGPPPTYDDLLLERDILDDVYKCPFCGEAMIDPAPGTLAKKLQDLGYAHWRADGQPAHVTGAPCWNCEPVGAAAARDAVDDDLPF